MPTLFITESSIASKDNKHKYTDDHQEEEEAKESTTTSKKRRTSDSSSTDDSLSEEEPTWWARFDDRDTTDLENDSIGNDGGTSNDRSND
jgi:hypothetical protein